MLFALFSRRGAAGKKVPRIGFLNVVLSDQKAGRIEAFRQGFRELGYVEGKNIVIEYPRREKI